VLNNPSGISEDAPEVYSWLNGNNLEVIKGSRGTPQFIDLDLLGRLKKQIKSTPVKTDHDTKALAFLSGRTSTQIIGDYTNGTISSYASGFANLFGSSFSRSKVNQFEFSFGVVQGWACVGFIETQDVESLKLEFSYRKKSLVICSDDANNLNTKFLVKVDVAKRLITFQDEYYNQKKSLQFNNVEDLVYTVQFHDQGTVYFGQKVEYYQPLKSKLRKSSIY